MMLAFALIASAISCRKDTLKSTVKNNNESEQVKPKKTSGIPTRSTLVFFGIEDKGANEFEALGSTANYTQWQYVRSTIDGTYVNFIHMIANNLNSGTAAQNISNIYNALNRTPTNNKNVVFETSEI